MSAADEQRALLADAADKLFSMIANAPAPADGEAHDTEHVDATHWQQVEESGFTSVLVPESAGGFGGGWEDAFVILHCAGLHAVPLPLAETMIAQQLLSEARIVVPPGPIALACLDDVRLVRAGGGWRFQGRSTAAPWAHAVPHVALACEVNGVHHVALLAASQLRVGAISKNIAGEPLADIHLDDVQVTDVGAVSRDPFLLGALARSVLMAGALSAVLQRSVEHANDRRQFGRPIGKFQAIQHALAALANETAAVNCSALAACRAADRGDAAFEIGAAKLRANRAAGAATSIAHQVHGAVGFAQEHPLHRATQRLWSWRSDYGSDRYWASRLGTIAAACGAHGLWPYLTALGDRVASMQEPMP